MSIKQVRLSNQAKEQLIRLKTRTGIQQWNILCRWALCLSLKELTPPTPIDIPADSNVEMTWQVFGGEHNELYLALLKQRCTNDGLPLDTTTSSGPSKIVASSADRRRGMGLESSPHQAAKYVLTSKHIGQLSFIRHKNHARMILRKNLTRRK